MNAPPVRRTEIEMEAMVPLVASVAASFGAYGLAQRAFPIPWFLNLLGSFCVWAFVFCVGSFYLPMVGPAHAEMLDTDQVLKSALAFGAAAVACYACAYGLHRAMPRR